MELASTTNCYTDLVNKGNYIAGKWYYEGTGDHLSVVDKYTGEEMAKLPLATEAQAEEAIQASERGFEAYKKWSAGDRSGILFKLRDAIKEHQEELARLIVDESGKPLDYAQGEISRCITTVEIAAMEALRFTGETIPIDFGAGEGKTAFTKPFPIGPILCITPFNFPLNLVLHKVAPALAVGCSVLIKPAPQTPLSTLALCSLIEKLNLPEGTFNVVNCDIPVAEKMVRDDRLPKLSFTGSEKVGWYLKSIAGRKKVTLELGGNAPAIIDESADIEDALKKLIVGTYIYAGQVCISTQRILVHEKIYEDFSKRLIDAIDQINVGNPIEHGTLVGPVIDRGNLNRINDWVNEAVGQGAEVLAGGSITSEAHNIYAPTLLSNTNTNMKVNCAEVFGPVAVIETFKDFDQAIALANDSDYGLQAGVFTNSLENFKIAHERLEVGGVIINNVPGFRIDSMPYGGIKGSGFGREGIKYAMAEMVEERLLVY